MSAEYVKSVHLEPGDHFIGWGPGWIVAKPGPQYLGEGDIGGSAFRQKYVVPFVNLETGERRELPITGESKTNVIRGWAATNDVEVPS